MRFIIYDNDRIEGIYYQSAIDEVANSTVDNSTVQIGAYGTLAGSIGQSAFNGSKVLLQKSRSLDLPEGYTIYLAPVKQKQ